MCVFFSNCIRSPSQENKQQTLGPRYWHNLCRKRHTSNILIEFIYYKVVHNSVEAIQARLSQTKTQKINSKSSKIQFFHFFFAEKIRYFSLETKCKCVEKLLKSRFKNLDSFHHKTMSIFNKKSVRIPKIFAKKVSNILEKSWKIGIFSAKLAIQQPYI